MFSCSYTSGSNTYLLGFTVLLVTLQAARQTETRDAEGKKKKKKKQGCDTFLPCHTFLSPPLRAEAQSGTQCVGAVFGKLKLQAPEPAAQAAQTAHFGCLFQVRPYIFEQFNGSPLR